MAEILNKDIYKFLKLCNEHPTGLELTDVIYYDKKEWLKMNGANLDI